MRGAGVNVAQAPMRVSGLAAFRRTQGECRNKHRRQRRSGSAGVDSGTTASTSIDFNTALSSIGDESSAAALRTMTDVSSVTVVDVSETANADTAALDSAIEANATQIDEVRASLHSNAAVNAALEAQQVDASQVIAANVAADGSLTVLWNKSRHPDAWKPRTEVRGFFRFGEQPRHSFPMIFWRKP